jgi:hypothetical protein
MTWSIKEALTSQDASLGGAGNYKDDSGYVFGGWDYDDRGVYSFVDAYAPASDTWTFGFVTGGLVVYPKATSVG